MLLSRLIACQSFLGNSDFSGDWFLDCFKIRWASSCISLRNMLLYKLFFCWSTQSSFALFVYLFFLALLKLFFSADVHPAIGFVSVLPLLAARC